MFRRLGKFIRRYKKIWLALGAVFLIWYIFSLPRHPFDSKYSTVLYDRNGKLLGARVSADGQWRFPPAHQVPKRFETCLLEFEDRQFHSHIGISFRGIGRAVVQNFKNKKTVSGASTITMQVARMMGKRKSRNVFFKVYEMILATRLEIKYSKNEILEMYCNHAPFGNNVVGLDAAAWRYFGRSADKLSWAECATLAVLPNAPGLIYPGKNHNALLAKRNRLLKRLYEQKKLDATSYELALMEPIPGKPLSLPDEAPHLLQSLVKQHGNGRIFNSTIDADLQAKIVRIARLNGDILRNNDIKNGAIIITETSTGEVLAYLGNLPDAGKEEGKDVDCSRAIRSSGSTLKPLLFESALEEGLITPKTLLMDIPSQFGGYAPKNFSKSYEGVIPANQALSKSLNIPFVLLLNQYGQPKFCNRIKNAGLKTIRDNPSKYGLTLILGGAEVTLWDLTSLYRNMGALASNAIPNGMQVLKNSSPNIPLNGWDKSCVYSTLECMTELNRPDEEGNWKLFGSARKIAWKTGTSFGFRDAWALGTTPDYTVGVWIGNADGEGKPGLTGVKAAAPVLFDIFSLLPYKKEWFTPNIKNINIAICKESGLPASPECPHVVNEMLPQSCQASQPCTYHKILNLSPDKKYQANSSCFNIYQIQKDTYFILPPLAMKYYRQHATLKEIPPFFPGCTGAENSALSLVYPKPGAKVYLARQQDGKRGEIVFEAAHRGSKNTLYWHLDEEYLGSTNLIHHMICAPEPGKHRINVTDEKGQTVSVEFEVL